MQGNHAQGGQQQLIRLRNCNQAIGHLGHLPGTVLRGEGQYVRPPALHLHHVAHGLFKQPPIGAQSHHQCAVLDEGDGSVLEFPGGIGLGVDIGDLLELQRSLQPQGIVHVAADVKHRVVVEVLAGIILNILPFFQHLFHLGRQQQQFLHRLVVPFLRHGPPLSAKIQCQQIHHRQLGGVGLGGSHGDLRSGPGVEHHVRLPGDGRAYHVDDG